MKFIKDKFFYFFTFVSLFITAPLCDYLYYARIIGLSPEEELAYQMGQFSYIKWYFSNVLSLNSFEFLLTVQFQHHGFTSLDAYKMTLLTYVGWLIPSIILAVFLYFIFNFFRK